MENNNSKTNCITKAIKANFCTAITYMLVCIIAVIALFANALLGKNTPKLSAMQLAERQKLSTYAELDENNKKAENCSFVEFSAFFTNDKDNKGNAIKRIGTCKRVNEKDILYIDLNVLTNGYLENGQIVIEGANFVYNANTLEDELIKSIATNENTTTINLNQLTAGTQKLIPGEISLKLNNINDYSNTENKITLTGTHVSNDNVRTAINVTREVTVDWYGETEVNPEVYVYEKEMVYSYNSSEAKTVAVNFAVDEIKEELLLKNNYVEVEIPQLNNIAPESVICVNGGVASEYDAENRILKLTKSSEVDSNGNVTNKLPYSNTYTIAVGYPAMAFEGLEEGTKIDFNIKANYTAYNNPSAEFNGGEEKVVPNNTVTSNQATGVASIVFKNEEKIEGSKINFSVNIVNKLYNDRTKVFGISKEALLQYYTNSDEAQNFKYTVEWDAEIRANTSVDNIKMSEIPAEVLVGETSEGKAYGDKFDENEVDKYVANTGIYFVGATETLGESGKIFIYNNDTNDLIYTFDASNWNTYNAQNPFVYITTANNETVNTPVKHIRIETTAVTNTEQAKVLRVFNIKELDKTLFKNDFTEEDGKAFIQNAQLLYTNIEGTAKYTETTSVGGNETTEEKEITVKAVDSAYLEQKVSFADISIEPKQVSTAKELKNAEIRIATKVENEFDSNWQNGKFIVEIPNEIIGVNVSKVEIESVSQNGSAAPNTSVTIENWEQTNLEDGKHILKISTTNETPATYVIKITADLTADYRIGGGTKEIKLYAYNSLAEIYYNTAKDVYDINGNEATDENIAGATANFEIVSAQELITYDTVTNYTKVSSEGEQGESNSESLGGTEVLAPKIAEVDNNEGLATINIVLKNGYRESIKNIKVLGRFPVEGNKSVISNDDMSSAFTANISKNGINIPQELEGKIDIYYSANENADEDITKEENGWKKLDEFLNEEDLTTFMSSVKSYFIDFKESEFEGEKKYVFSYEVTIPEAVDYNVISYCNHAVYYDVESVDGTLKIKTEPAKLGIKNIKKIDLHIATYKKGTEEKISAAKYKLIWFESDINGNLKEKSKILTSNSEGEITVENLYRGIEYSLQQTNTEIGYSNISEIIKFKVSKIGLEVLYGENSISEKAFVNDVVNLKIENKRVFVLQKFASTITNSPKLSVSSNQTIEGAKFVITDLEGNYVLDSNGNIVGIDEEINGTILKVVTTDENGIVSLELPSGKLYKVVEVQASRCLVAIYNNGGNWTYERVDCRLPDAEENRTYYFGVGASKEASTIDGVYQPEIKDLTYLRVENRIDERKIDYDAIENKNNAVEQYKENDTIYKIDEKTGEKISGVTFQIYETDKNYNNPVMKKTVITDSNGIATLGLPNGYYKAIETDVPENYELEENIEDRTTYFEIKTSYSKRSVEYIEDLIDIAEDVNTNLTSYNGQTIYLVRDLDMDDRNSYIDSDAISKYDYNKNGTLESLWNELHTEGCDYGIIPIGNGPIFYGNFDGCGHSLKNFKIGQGQSYTGLFGKVWDGTIANIEIKGNTIINGGTYVGTIAGIVRNGKIENCCSLYSTGGKIIGNAYVGGLVGQTLNSSCIKNCFNANDINTNASYAVGGIVGSSSGDVLNCYNIGNVTAENASDVAGISGGRSDSQNNIVNCYNEGTIRGYALTEGIIDNASNVINCYNIGFIKSNQGCAGIVNASGSNEVINTYNMGVLLAENSKKGQIVNSTTLYSYIKNSYYPENASINETENGTALSLNYMKSSDFTAQLNNNLSNITTSYNLSRWKWNGNYSTLENVGVSSQCVTINRATYVIENASQLRQFASDWNSGNITGDVLVSLEKDIDLGNQEFTPIGRESNPFKGTFEGNGHVVKGLYISKYTISGSFKYAGFFGVIKASTINNLGIEGKIKIIDNTNSQCIAGLVGIANPDSGTSIIINKCYSNVDIDAQYLIGGLVGFCQNSGRILIYNSFNSGKLTIENLGPGASGIVGNTSMSTYIEIINCYNSGEIQCKNSYAYGIAYSANKIENCINAVEFSEENTRNYGITSSASVFNSYYITGKKYDGSQLGIEKTNEQMKSKEFCNTLNENIENIDTTIKLKRWKYNAGAYPTLRLTEYGLKNDIYLQILNKSKKIVEIIKEDEETSERLIGADFKVETTKDVECYNDYPYIGEKQYYAHNNFGDFKKIGNKYIADGSYVDRFGNHYEDSQSNFEIDLSGYNGQYALQYDAKISSSSTGYYSKNYGYTYLNGEGSGFRKLSISGNTSTTHTINLVSGVKNKFYIENIHNSEGIFEVSNLRLLLNGKAIDYSIAYNSEISGYADKCIHIDLTNKDGKYLLELDAYIQSKENSNFGYALLNNSSESTISDEDIENAFLYISGSINDSKYRVELDGGNEYYLHIGCQIGDTTDYNTKFIVNSVKLKEVINKTYTTNEEGKIKFNVLQGDWVRITETKAPNGYTTLGYTNTITVDEDTQLTVKNSKSKIFTINKIDEETQEPIEGVKFAIYKVNATHEIIEQAKDENGNYIGTLEDGVYVISTGSNGKINLNLPEGSYKAIEIQPAYGYIFEENENLRTTYFDVTYGVEQSDINGTEGSQTVVNNSLTITNQKLPRRQLTIIKKDKDSQEQLSGAEIKLEKIEENEGVETYTEVGTYTSSNTEAIIENIYSTYKYRVTEIKAPKGYAILEEPIIVTQGTEAVDIVIENKKIDKFNCRIHHYLIQEEQSGEPQKLQEDTVETLNNGEHYLIISKDKTETDYQGEYYEIKPSEELLKEYELVSTVTENEAEEDTYKDIEVTYYYQVREHKITTEVEIPEGRTDKGGSITGDKTVEGNGIYEEVQHNQNSLKDIIIEPKPGYRIAQIRVESIDTQGNKTETIVYGENQDSKSEIKARKLKNGNTTLTNFYNVQEDKEIIVLFEPDDGGVVVHHYIENTTEKLSKDEYTNDMIGKIVETAPIDKERYVLVSGPEGEERTKIITEKLQEVTYYYQYEYRITTNVIEHTEKYKDGTVKKNVKGGTISGEDLTPYEGVLKGRNNTKDIIIKPDDGYEVVKVTIKGEDGIAKDFDFKEIAKTNDKVVIDENGILTIKGGFFENMQEDKHIEVEFRKKSKVIVKYLEEETEKVLAKTEDDKSEFIQTGYEGKDFTAEHKIIPLYEDANPDVTIEDTEDFSEYDQVALKSITENGSKYAEGTMYADDITIIYWYKKIEADVIERHIEINEKKETTEIEHTTYTKKLEEEVETNRNKYDGYIPVDGPSSSSDLVKVMKGTENTKTVTPVEGDTVEVWYYYEKQFKITTEVKPHDETKVDETTGKETKVKVDGGTISKEYKKDEQGEYVLDDKGNKIEIDYEHVLNRGDATKEIVIEPEENYRVKSLTVNGNSVDFEKFKVDDTEKVIIPETYFKDIQENKHVVVEFEKIPAKVIVKYIDIDTKEELIDEKVIVGEIKDPYNEPRVQIEGYISAGEEPTNNTGIMTKEPITVIYYYTKEYKITTEVKAHEEIEEKSIVDVTIEKSEETNPSKKVVVKGGTITGELTEENKEPIEIVLRGKDSTKEIIMKPEKGYRIKSITVLDGNREGAESDTHTVKEYEIDIKELYKKDGTAIIPEKYFKNMQADKHIIVEYEKIPSKVIVNYLEKGTEAIVADQEIGKGFVDYEYVTHEKEIPYYELLKDELPENAEGVLVEKDTIVNYWYRRLLFNMKITKEFTSILVNGNEKLGKDNKLAKVEIKNSDLANSSILVKYKLTVTNTEEIAGIAVITEQIPEGFKLSEKSKAEWALTDGKYTLTTKELQPGERVEYEVILEWDKNAKYVGKFENIATIISTDNKAQFTEETLEDNQDSATLIIAIRTGGEITTLVISTIFIILLGILTILLIFKKTSTPRYVPKHY